MTHELVEIVEFDSRVVGYDDGLPIREPVTAYFRWYCICGGIGGRSGSHRSAAGGFAKHLEEKSA